MKDNHQMESNIELQVSHAQARLNKLTDLLLDGLISENEFLLKKENIHLTIANLEEKKSRKKLDYESIKQEVKKLLELPQSLISLNEMGDMEKKRLLLKKAFSNLVLKDGELVITTKKPLSWLLFSDGVSGGGHSRNTTRTYSREKIDYVVKELSNYYTQN
jgi:hypothetical protein